MLAMLILFGIAGIVVFHAVPAIVYMLVWYTMVVTCLYFCERTERH